ncbi:MAG: type II toxin-antitoxin system PemK/MazF family toxin [Oscillatoria sp. Prado101]|nr:type II toxin-antitoxin system PemK/MazF family toxin [Oscillatoria sp. Prado101]
MIICGIFSKIPAEELRETWVLIAEEHPEFGPTGLKKASLIRADKIATVHKSVFQKQLGILPADIRVRVQEALKKALGIPP